MSTRLHQRETVLVIVEAQRRQRQIVPELGGGRQQFGRPTGVAQPRDPIAQLVADDMHYAVRIGAARVLGQGRAGDLAREVEPPALEQMPRGQCQDFGGGWAGWHRHYERSATRLARPQDLPPAGGIR